MITISSLRYATHICILARIILIFVVSLIVAAALNYDNYKDFYGKRLFRMHTADLRALADQMTIKLNFFLDQGNSEGVQNVLDASFGLFGFVVTDCRRGERLCPEQKILFTSDPTLPWLNFPDVSSLNGGSFALLRRPPIVGGREFDPRRPPGEIIGRLYVISNMPAGFAQDYRQWLQSPFSDIGARRFYLRTTFAFVMGALIICGVTELYFMIRRRQQQLLQRREFELKEAVNRQMKLLSAKDAHIKVLNDETRSHYEAYVEKIRALNRKIRNEEEYRELAEQIIDELEQDKAREVDKYAEELATVRQDMERLQEKINQFEESTQLKRESSYKALEEAVRTPNFSNVFEQRIYEIIAGSEKFKRGEWRLLSNYDVAPGRNYRQFTDFVLFNRDAVIIIEAKYYSGVIDSPGDFLNDIWISVSSQRKKIDCLWGENPYHQLNEYAMSMMKILKQRSPWTFQIFGVIVFPDEADISKIGAHLGKFYRVTTVGKLPALAESIFAEAHRFQSAKNPRRPGPEQVEDMLRGRRVTS